MSPTSKSRSAVDGLDRKLRMFVYRHVIWRGRAPLVAEMAKSLARPAREIRAALARLSQSHAFMVQENGELWRVAPFSAIPTAFPVRVGRKSWFGNCIWDALGIPAMLKRDARIDAACGCCNLDMPLEIRKGRLRQSEGIVHIAVPARDWYKDVVFT
jgi:Alkylmercury lyase